MKWFNLQIIENKVKYSKPRWNMKCLTLINSSGKEVAKYPLRFLVYGYDAHVWKRAKYKLLILAQL